MTEPEVRYLNFRGCKTAYMIHGEDQKGAPLIVVHGGPGYPHNSLNNTAKLAEGGFPVVLYDQLGCGLSDRPEDLSLWVIDTFLEELDSLRRHLGFEKISLLGHSWGGSLAIEYCLKYGRHVDKLILHSPLIDTKLWTEEADKLKDQLPDNLGDRMRLLEQSGNTDSEEYRELSELFNDMFVLRLKPKPQDAIDGERGVGLKVYNTMWGPSEACATGSLKNWSAVDRLKDIKQKTLLISGRHDEATLRQMRIVVDSIPDIDWKLFENSSHCANLEEPERYVSTVSGFIASRATS